jgi:hypothetical protein
MRLDRKQSKSDTVASYSQLAFGPQGIAEIGSQCAVQTWLPGMAMLLVLDVAATHSPLLQSEAVVQKGKHA